MQIHLSKRRSGNIMINALIIAFFLVMSGTAFMMWAVDESYQAEYDLARTQAYYVAQHGILEEVITDMRKRSPETLPAGIEPKDNGRWYVDDSEVGAYSEVTLQRVSDLYIQGVFNSTFYYDLRATGTVMASSADKITPVSRTVRMRTKLRTYASYMYLTDQEQTMFNEIIWFWTPDTLYGRVHSNSHIGIKYSPRFYGPVSTTEDEFLEFSAAPWFAYPPQFGAPPVYFPTTAENLRSGAQGGGTYIHNNNGMWKSRLVGEQGGWHLWQWDWGTPFDSTNIDNEDVIPYGSNLAIFVEGDVELWGDWISGSCTVGTSGTMELWDNVKIAEVSEQNPDVSAAQSIVGLVSEGFIRIKDTYANGRGNGLYAPGGYERKHIVITAAMVALGESFTFEHQNDTWNEYRWCDPTGQHANETDERGTIWLRGSVTQMRRGYVHRSTCGGTGYAKDYVYDFRLDSTPPPFYLEAVDEGGSSLFDVVYWQEELPQ